MYQWLPGEEASHNLTEPHHWVHVYGMNQIRRMINKWLIYSVKTGHFGETGQVI